MKRKSQKILDLTKEFNVLDVNEEAIPLWLKIYQIASHEKYSCKHNISETFEVHYIE